MKRNVIGQETHTLNQKSKIDKQVEENLIVENQHFKMKNEYTCLSSGREQAREQEKVIVAYELRQKYSLKELLKLVEMLRNIFYYHLKSLKKEDKYKIEEDKILSISHENKGCCRYRRITLEIKNSRYIINHKTVARLIKLMGLKRTQKLKEDIFISTNRFI